MEKGRDGRKQVSVSVFALNLHPWRDGERTDRGENECIQRARERVCLICSQAV